MSIIPPVRRCTKCGIEYPATKEFFYAHPKCKYGLTSKCKSCRKAEEKDRRPRSRELARIQYHKNPEKHRIAQRKRRIAKGDEINRQRRALYDPEKARVRNAKTYLEHKKEARLYSIKYKTRKLNLPNDFTKRDWDFALEYFHYRCAVCGRQLNDLFGTHKAALDHWIPLVSPQCPGTIPSNMVPLCHGVGGCNNSKRGFMPEKWLLKQYDKRKANRIMKRIAAYFTKVRAV